ncbi:MAG: hypothetical protein KDA89_16825, partial [Planctomycetaceae bacterium]|nr:hypothetical protein [Planctomycetaceae bacterium]
LPKLFGRQRKLERGESSFHRFSQRRAVREAIEHSERDIRRLVQRDLIQLLSYCRVWQDTPIERCAVHVASNSFQVALHCPKLGSDPIKLLIQEQSHWLVAVVASPGWLKAATPEQVHSFETALQGFYCKAGVELVREQLERSLIGIHPYDICDSGLVIWPDGLFDREVRVDLNRRHQLRPLPSSLAATYGLQPASRDSVVFSESPLLWTEWETVWSSATDSGAASDGALPLACVQSVRAGLICLPR